jgi:succinyl-diaminopimelate desuccinylase
MPSRRRSDRVVELTQELIRCDTALGSEARAVSVLAPRLEAAGLCVEVHPGEDPARAQLVAVAPGRTDEPALTLSGHLDTVPARESSWSRDVRGEIDGDRLHGLGSSDMKGGVAAFVVALETLLASGRRPRLSVQLVLSSGEETGCDGIRLLAARPGALLPSDALLVAEPTTNVVRTSHKGVLWLVARSAGRSAHGSAPWLGDNAIYRLAAAVAGLAEHVELPFAAHPLLGPATLNVGMIRGGANINSVPDRAEAWLDCRVVPGAEAPAVREAVAALLGPGIALEVERSLDPVLTDASDPWPALVRSAAAALGRPADPAGLSYFTDASVLAATLGAATVICGPGDPDQAHAPDESCAIGELERSVELYADVISSRCGW